MSTRRIAKILYNFPGEPNVFVHYVVIESAEPPRVGRLKRGQIYSGMEFREVVKVSDYNYERAEQLKASRVVLDSLVMEEAR